MIKSLSATYLTEPKREDYCGSVVVRSCKLRTAAYTGESISLNFGLSDFPIYTGSGFIGYSFLSGESFLTKK